MSWRARVVIAAVCAGAMGTAIVLVLRGHRRPAPAEAARPIATFPLRHLPSTTRRVARTLADEDEPAQARWSRRSEQLCGGYDVFALAMLAAETGNEYEQLLRALAAPRKQLRAALECGKRFADGGEPRVASYSVAFTVPADGGKDYLSAGLAVSGLDSMPAAAAPFSDAGLSQPFADARCFVGWGQVDAAVCRPEDHAAARLVSTKLWAYGEVRELAELGRQRSQGSEERLLGLAERVASSRYFAVARDDAAVSSIIGSLRVDPFPDTGNSHKIRDVVNDAADLYAISNDTSLAEGPIQFIAEARNPGDAEAGAHALRQYVQRVAQSLRGEQPLNLGHGTEPVEVIEYERVEQAARRRTWASIDVSRTDRRFQFEVRLKLLESERPVRARYVAWRRARREAAARLVDALLANADIKPALRTLGGDYLVKRATQAFYEFFEGEFECTDPPLEALAHLSFRDGQLWGGAEHKAPLGRYRYATDVFRRPSARVWLETDGGGQLLELTESGGGIVLSGPPRSTQTRCQRTKPRAPVEPPPHRARAVSFELPKPQQGNYYSHQDFRRMGWRVEPLDSDRASLRGFGPVARVCLQPLPCAEKDECITLERNLEVFRAALKPGQERSVSCERAEVGRCGKFRYFLFDGDIHRYEVRWFDANGKLVGQRNSTDYDAYCGGAMHVFLGQVPYCNSAVVEEVICGQPGRPITPPLRDLQGLLRSGVLLEP